MAAVSEATKMKPTLGLTGVAITATGLIAPGAGTVAEVRNG
jgi:hypothetical protein